MVTMLKKILVLNLLLLSFRTRCENIFFISKSSKNNLTYCVTDSEYAMSWINPNPNEQVSNYVPDSARRTQIKTENWSSRWNISNDVILDRRWEEMNVIVTNNLSYIPLFKRLDVNFIIPFSVRADNIHLFLCESPPQVRSMCYQLSLENFENRTEVRGRQCSKRAIIFPNSGNNVCLPNNNQIKFLHQNYISYHYWSHFKVSKRNKTLSLDHYNGSSYNTIWKYPDLDPETDMSELIIHSKSANSFWKVHEVKYFYTSTEGSNIFWENFSLPTEKNEICVSFYFLMCKFCRLKLTLKKDQEIIRTKICDDNKPKWSFMRFFAENLPPSNYTLSLTTVGLTEDKMEEYFWAVDEIRECRKKEFRIIRSFEKTQCQLMSYPDNVVSIENSISKKLKTSFNIEQILFQQQLYDNGENQIKFCYSLFNEETVCSCQKGFYGDICKNKCECNNEINQECDITGKCFHCPLYYTGKNCDVLLPTIKDLLVASKSESYIYLKWKPALLPSGSQLLYEIKLSSNYETLNFTITNSSHCDIWPECLCHTIDNLKNNTEYTIEINTKYYNEFEFERTDTGPTTMTRVITKTEPSEAPYDLKLIWNEGNNLTLEWKHPNQSNGHILYYAIDFPFNNRNYSLKTDKYNLTYHFEVPNKISPSSQFVVEISAFNGFEGKKIIKSGSSPPDIPSLTEKPEISGSANTIEITISPKKSLGVLQNEHYIFLLISDAKSDNFSYPELTKFNLSNLKMVMRCNLTMGFGERKTFVIGNGAQGSNCDRGIENSELEPETSYNVTVILKNTFRMKDRYKIYSFKCSTTNNGGSLIIAFSVTTTLFVVLLITTPIAIYVLKKRRKQQLPENHELIEISWPQPQPHESPTVEPDEDSSTYYERIDEETENEPDQYCPHDLPRTEYHEIPSKDDDKGKNDSSESEPDVYSPLSSFNTEQNIPSNDYENIRERDLSTLLANGLKNALTLRHVKQSTSILVKDFAKYYSNLRRGNKLEQQFNDIFDENCREYEPTRNGECFDYVNMSYHNGSVIKKAYIATDLNTKGSVEDFWKIVWNDNVQHIILHKGYYEKQNFMKYWPQNNESMHCHGILVKLTSSKTLEKFHYRKFVLIYKYEMKEVDQVQFPYNGLNPRKYVPLFKKMETFSLESDKPILVHGSHGLASVGLILLCDMSLRMAKEENVIDVCKNLQELAKNNIELAGNIVQYGFVHTIIFKYITSEEDYEYPEQNYYLNY